MSLSNTNTTPRPSRIDRPRSSSLAVLIEVPAVTAAHRSSRRIDPAAVGRRSPVGRPGTARSRAAAHPRRRLRHEIRLTARVFLGLAIVAGAGTLFGMARPGPAASTRPAVPRVAISREPAIAPPAVDLTTPVVFPGYLLPDDAMEAPAHEGG